MLNVCRDRSEPSRRCRRCGSGNLVTIQTHGPHWAAEICADCRRHQRWVPKPESQRVRRPAGHRDLVQRYSEGFCEMCQRTEEELPRNQVLEGHHVREYQDGGSADRTNVWIVCTACHKLISWVRAWVAGRGQGSGVRGQGSGHGD